jgi:hypothetical protein
MDINYIIYKQLGPEVEFNPACFDLSESDAKAKNLWRSSLPMPTKEQLQTWWNTKYKAEIEALNNAEKNKKKRFKDLVDKKNFSKEEVEEVLLKILNHLGLDKE